MMCFSACCWYFDSHFRCPGNYGYSYRCAAKRCCAVQIGSLLPGPVQAVPIAYVV